MDIDCNADGHRNLAPCSFFNAFNYVPPIIGYKDTVRNIEQTGEFVWNLTTRALASAMKQTCAPVPPQVSEFDIAGLTAHESTLVRPARVAESPVFFECKATQIIQLEGLGGVKVSSWLVLGEVVAVHINNSLVVNGICDTAKAGHVLRGGVPPDYFSVGPERLFRMHRPH